MPESKATCASSFKEETAEAVRSHIATLLRLTAQAVVRSLTTKQPPDPKRPSQATNR